MLAMTDHWRRLPRLPKGKLAMIDVIGEKILRRAGSE